MQGRRDENTDISHHIAGVFGGTQASMTKRQTLSALGLSLVLCWVPGVCTGASSTDTSIAQGVAAYEQGDYRAAYRLWRPQAEAGHAVAQYNLAVLLYNGQGTSKDLQRAFNWFERSAKRGYPIAQYDLGMMYHDGEGVARDDKLAITWLSKAAENDHPPAQLELGRAYHHGAGPVQDYAKALAWYNRAADNGISEAEGLIREVYTALFPAPPGTWTASTASVSFLPLDAQIIPLADAFYSLRLERSYRSADGREGLKLRIDSKQLPSTRLNRLAHLDPRTANPKERQALRDLGKAGIQRFDHAALPGIAYYNKRRELTEIALEIDQALFLRILPDTGNTLTRDTAQTFLQETDFDLIAQTLGATQ